MSAELEEKLMQLIMQDDDKAINDREVQGSKFAGITDIIEDQSKVSELQ